MTRLRIVAVAVALVCATHALLADVRADEKTHVEFAGMLGRMANLVGGKAAREGVTSSVAVKGDRKATLNDATGQIIDLGEEKIYDLDLKKKTYKVTTFDELRRRMEEAQQKAAENARKEEGNARAQSAPAAQNEKQMEIDVDIKNTGQTKTINGFNTRETVMTVTMREKGKTIEQAGGMVLTTDMWLAPKIDAMREIAEFDARYAQKLYGGMLTGVSADQMATAMAMYPMMKQMIGRMNVEGTKIDGTAILSTVTMDSVKSDEEMAQAPRQNDAQDSQPSVRGFLDGLAKKAAARKAGGDDAAQQRATFMTSTTEVLKVATDLEAHDLAIPTGFKENK